MLPIQTFLILLALLMAMGCSQKPPPIPGGRNAEKSADATKTQTLPKNTDAHISGGNEAPPRTLPQVEAGKTQAQIEADGRWMLHIDGEGAQKLFEATAVAEKDGKKTGLQYECIRDQSAYRCSIAITAVDGSVKNLISKGDLKAAEATFKPEKPYTSNPNFVAITEASKGAYATLDIEGANGEKIFNDLTQTRLQQDLPPAQLFGNDYDTGMIKYGTQVLCYMRPLKSDSKIKHHWCYLYLGTDVGSVNLISLPNSK